MALEHWRHLSQHRNKHTPSSEGFQEVYMQIYHPNHGILILSDQAEIKRLLDNGGSVFDINDKRWGKKNEANEIKEITKTIEANEETEVLSAPRRGRPKLNGNN